MSSNYSFLVAAACALPLSLAACGGSSSESAIVPEGTHYGYVVSNASIPTSDAQVMQFGLDLGGPKSSKLDGTVDNKLGSALSFLSSLMFKVQDPVTTAIDHGDIILLIDLQTKDLANSSAAGFSVKIGAMPNPPACNPAGGDTICRRHLDGHGSFQLAAGSPTDALVAGKIVSSAFSGGPGDVTLQLALGATAAINLNLVHARVQATLNPDNTLTATLGGLVLHDELLAQIGPVLQAQIMGLLTTQCTPGGPGTCGCPATSQASTLLSLGLDADGNCMITTQEVTNFSLVKTQLQADSCSMDTCTASDAVSLGIKVQAVKATFPGAM